MIIISKQKNKILICSGAGIVNLILFFVKIYIALSSNSISIYVDSLNSLADTFICIMAVIGFNIAAIKPNEKYPFGYGKTEDLIDFILSLVILFTGCAFVYSSLQRLMYPVPVWFSPIYAVIIAVTALVKLVMAFVYRAFNKKNNSSVIKNLSVDSILDFFVSACIVVSFTLTTVFGYAIDSIMGLIASLIIIVSGIKALISVCERIIGKKDIEFTNKAFEILSRNDIKIVKLECHSYGEHKIINAEIKADLDSTNDIASLLSNLKDQINEQLNASLFVTFGGK